MNEAVNSLRVLGVDFENHTDHRMLSLRFEQVMVKILSRSGNNYSPEVFKRFAYSAADFFSDDLLETKKSTIQLAIHGAGVYVFLFLNIINSDEVFFRCRTDSITFPAHVSSSSGNPDYIHDFMLIHVRAC